MGEAARRSGIPRNELFMTTKVMSAREVRRLRTKVLGQREENWRGGGLRELVPHMFSQ